MLPVLYCSKLSSSLLWPCVVSYVVAQDVVFGLENFTPVASHGAIKKANNSDFSLTRKSTECKPCI